MDMLKKVFNGDERLVITFWVWGFVGSIIVAFALGFGLVFLGITSPIIIGLINLPYSIFIWVGVWRSSDNYQGAQIWAILAKVMVGLGVLYTIYGFVGGAAFA